MSTITTKYLNQFGNILRPTANLEVGEKCVKISS